MASAGGEIGGAPVIEMDGAANSDEISPLLAGSNGNGDGRERTRPKMSIFSVSCSRKRSPSQDISKGSSIGAAEVEVDPMVRFISWVWSGSRYSGLLCAALSSAIYFAMEMLTAAFPVRSVPLFQTLFTRCTIILLLSFLWLRRAGQPLSVSTHVRNLLILRSVTGLISVLSFIYSVQNLPLSLAVMLNFTIPVVASIGAKIILQEKLATLHLGGIACSFAGLLLSFTPMLGSKGNVHEASGGKHLIFATLLGIFSSILGGLSCCLVQAGAKASDHPAYTVLSFGLLATPVSLICTFTLEEFVLPSVFILFLMLVLGILAFFAELCLARGLQMDKVSKVANILYMKVLLSQAWSMAFLGAAPSFTKLIGCLLILASLCSTLYLGPEKETMPL